MGKKFEFTADKEVRVTSFLAAEIAGITRARADLLVKSGEVRVNGVKIKTNAVLSAGDKICVFVPDAVNKGENGEKGENGGSSVPIVYEDKNIVVFDKPKRTPYDGLPQLYGAPLFGVHRLDTNTTGLIIFAKTEKAQAELIDAFRDRKVEKIYEAVVYPAPPKQSDVLTAYTKLMPSRGLALVSALPKPGYKTMVTEYSVKSRIGNAAVVSVRPHTGRTHQIRAHMCFIGCPIVGEHKYGIKGKSLPDAPDTQMLAAVELTFSGLRGELEHLNGKTFVADSRFDLRFLPDGE